jgi:hypothetical protein
MWRLNEWEITMESNANIEIGFFLMCFFLSQFFLFDHDHRVFSLLGALPWKEMASHIKAPQQLAEYSILANIQTIIERMRYCSQQPPSQFNTRFPVSDSDGSLVASSSLSLAIEPPLSSVESIVAPVPEVRLLSESVFFGSAVNTTEASSTVSNHVAAPANTLPPAPTPTSVFYSYIPPPTNATLQSPFAASLPTYHVLPPVLLDMCDYVPAMSDFYAPFFSVGMLAYSFYSFSCLFFFCLQILLSPMIFTLMFLFSCFFC